MGSYGDGEWDSTLLLGSLPLCRDYQEKKPARSFPVPSEGLYRHFLTRSPHNSLQNAGVGSLVGTWIDLYHRVQKRASFFI